MRYKKKPLIIEAFKWTGGPDQTEDPVWFVDAIKKGTVNFIEDLVNGITYMTIDTLEGTMNVSPGDYVIQGVKGGIYPCKPDIFEASYNLHVPPANAGFSFGQVVDGLKEGKRYQRAGWNGKDMFIFLVNGSTFKVNREPLMSILGEGTEVNYHRHVDMKTADGTIFPWLCSQTDMLADDWCVI